MLLKRLLIKHLFSWHSRTPLTAQVAGPSIYRVYLAAAQRLGLSDDAAGYWELHIREDERHGRQMVEDVALPLVDRCAGGIHAEFAAHSQGPSAQTSPHKAWAGFLSLNFTVVGTYGKLTLSADGWSQNRLPSQGFG